MSLYPPTSVILSRRLQLQMFVLKHERVSTPKNARAQEIGPAHIFMGGLLCNPLLAPPHAAFPTAVNMTWQPCARRTGQCGGAMPYAATLQEILPTVAQEPDRPT